MPEMEPVNTTITSPGLKVPLMESVLAADRARMEVEWIIGASRKRSIPRCLQSTLMAWARNVRSEPQGET